MRRLLIAQFSDLHLGAGLAGGGLALPPEKVEQRREEQHECLERFATYVRETRPDMVLMPGDLFDDSEPGVDELNFLIDVVNHMAPTQVFIAPGRHDAYSPSSCYCTRSALYRSRGGPKWHNHVHVFTGREFDALAMPHHEKVTVTGVACQRDVPAGHRPLAELPVPPAGDGVHLLLFHGSLSRHDGAGGGDAPLPFTEDELAQPGYHYAAVGHRHHGGPIRDPAGRVLGAYAGAPFATSLADEGAGVGTWLEVQITPGQPVTDDAFTWRRADDRVVRRVEMNVTGLADAAALDERLNQLLDAQEARSPDLLHIVLRGRIARGVDYRPDVQLRDRFFHVSVDASGVEPDYDVDFSAPLPEEPGLAATSEEVFRWKMLKLFGEATTGAERERAREALLYGLDALTLGEIHLR